MTTSGGMAAPGYFRLVGTVSHTYRESGVYGEFINRGRLAAWSRAIDLHQLDLASVVDVGCSYGAWADNYRRLGFRRLIGVDPNPAVLPAARALYDEVHQAYSHEIKGFISDAPLIAANGVVVHILDESDTVRFLADLRAALATDGKLVYSVIHTPYYMSMGRGERVSESSCVRPLEKHMEYARAAGLEVLGMIGTFIEPWALRELEFLSEQKALRQSAGMYSPFEALADLVRPLGIAPFSELLMIARAA